VSLTDVRPPRRPPPPPGGNARGLPTTPFLSFRPGKTGRVVFEPIFPPDHPSGTAGRLGVLLEPGGMRGSEGGTPWPGGPPEKSAAV